MTMDTESVLNDLITELESNETGLTDTQAQLEQARKLIAALESRRDSLKVTVVRQRKERDSLQRRLKIEAEERRVNEQIQRAQEVYDTILNKLKFPHDPFGHQIYGASKLATAGRGMLADKRGLGKTLTAILWRHFIQPDKTLILAPSKLLGQLERMLYEWDSENDLTVINMSGKNKFERDFIFPMLHQSHGTIVLLNYESWRRDDSVIDHLVNAEFDAIIADEIHNAKESNKRVALGLKQLADVVPYMLAMTGTPILNRPQEIWAPLNMLYPDIFPSKKDFEWDYCMGDNNDWHWKPGMQDVLAKKISPFYLARTRDSIGVTVPPPEILSYELSFDEYPRQKDAYDKLTERAIMALKNTEVVNSLPSILAILTRQRQMTVWPAGIRFVDDIDGLTYQFDVHESVKLDWATETIKDLKDEEERAILFSNFEEPLLELERRLREAGVNVALYTGHTSAVRREAIERDFDLATAPGSQGRSGKPQWDVMLATYKTVGEGLNLNAARHAILLDREWNPGREEQAIGRIDRLNSTDQATVHIPWVKNSVDTFMRDLIERKSNLIDDYNTATSLQGALLTSLQESKKADES